MPPTVQNLRIDRLSREDRIVLVQEIWDTIAAEVPPTPLTETQREELCRRAEEDDANPDDVVSWDEVKAQALAGRR